MCYVYALADDVLKEFVSDIESYDNWEYVGKILYDNYTCMVLHKFVALPGNIKKYTSGKEEVIVSPSIYHKTFECFDNYKIKNPISLYKQYTMKSSQ